MKTLQKHLLASQCFSIVEKWKNWLISRPQKLLPAHVRLNQIGSAYRESRLLYLAVKLDIADSIADENVSINDLAGEQRLNLNKDNKNGNDNLYRVLRALASIGIFTEIKYQVFANNRFSKLLLRSNKWNVRQHVLRENQQSDSAVWLSKMESLLGLNNTLCIDNGSADSLRGNPFEGFDWSVFDLVFDLGNAKGEHILDMFQSSKNLNICIFDNSAGIKSAKMFWQTKYAQISTLRFSFEQGDMLTSLPKASSKFNLYCFAKVFRCLSDRDCLTILQNAQKAMSGFKATIAIVDSVLPEGGLNPCAALDDVQLLLENNGRHRTLKQWQYIINQSDFGIAEIVNLKAFEKILVLRLT